MKNIDYKKVERVNSYGSDTNLNVDRPGYYRLPIRNYGESYYDGRDCVWLQREVLKVSHNLEGTLVITQNPRKKSDVHMYYYNGSEQLFKIMMDMEYPEYREEFWESEHGFGHNEEADEFYNFWCELFDQYNKQEKKN